MANTQKGDADMKKGSGSLQVSLGIIICGVILSGLGWCAKQIIDLRVSISKLEVFAEKRVSTLNELNSGLEKRVFKVEEFNYGLEERFLKMEEHDRRQIVLAANRFDTKIPENHVDKSSERVIVPPTYASGTILSPSSGDVVSTVFNYKIELRNPDDTKYYYIVNRIGELYWPKVRINLRSEVTIYTGTSSEGGKPTDGQFSVVLFEIDTEMYENILRWLNGTDFGGIQIDGRELSSVDVLLRP